MQRGSVRYRFRLDRSRRAMSARSYALFLLQPFDQFITRIERRIAAPDRVRNRVTHEDRFDCPDNRLLLGDHFDMVRLRLQQVAPVVFQEIVNLAFHVAARCLVRVPNHCWACREIRLPLESI